MRSVPAKRPRWHGPLAGVAALSVGLEPTHGGFADRQYILCACGTQCACSMMRARAVADANIHQKHCVAPARKDNIAHTITIR